MKIEISNLKKVNDDLKPGHIYLVNDSIEEVNDSIEEIYFCGKTEKGVLLFGLEDGNRWSDNYDDPKSGTIFRDITDDFIFRGTTK